MPFGAMYYSKVCHSHTLFSFVFLYSVQNTAVRRLSVELSRAVLCEYNSVVRSHFIATLSNRAETLGFFLGPWLPVLGS